MRLAELTAWKTLTVVNSLGSQHAYNVAEMCVQCGRTVGCGGVLVTPAACATFGGGFTLL